MWRGSERRRGAVFSAADPKGYYRVLGVSPGAGEGAIKLAYRRKAMVLHPDHNSSPNAVAEFQLLNDAYQTLSTAKGREAYQRGGVTAAPPRPEPPPAPSLHACGACGKITAQPRYVIFEKVTGRRWRVQHESIPGVFCRRCADRVGLVASLHCWVRGWWALPSGPFHTLIALWINLKGGMRPRGKNATLLLDQARGFLARGQRDLAHELATHARDLSPTARDRAAAERLMNALGGDAPVRRLVNVWRRPGPGFWVQLSIPFTLVVILYLMAAPWLRDPPEVRSGAPRPAPAVGQVLVDPTGVSGGRVHAVSATTTTVRAGPGEAFETLAVIQRNTFVLVVDAGGTWARVVTAQGVLGYVPLADVRPMPE